MLVRKNPQYNFNQSELLSFDRENLKVNLTAFNEWKLDQVRNHIFESRIPRGVQASTNPFTLVFEYGLLLSCYDILDDFIAYDIASLNVERVVFYECVFGRSAILALLRLATTGGKKLKEIKVVRCSVVENLDSEIFQEECVKLMSAARLKELRLSYLKGQPMLEVFFGIDSITVNFDFGEPSHVPSVGISLSEAEEPSLITEEYTHVLTRVLKEVETFNELYLRDMHVSARTVIEICRVITSLNHNRTISLGLGKWEFTNSEANQAVCQVIRSKNICNLTIGGCFNFVDCPGLPVEMLTDALSASLSLSKLLLHLNVEQLTNAVEYMEYLYRHITTPTRLGQLFCVFTRFPQEDQLQSIQDALLAKLQRMQSKEAYSFITIVYAVANGLKMDQMKESPILMLNVDVLTVLARFLH